MDDEADYLEYEGFRIPVRLIPLAGGTPEQFGVFSAGYIDLLSRLFDLRADMNILDIGCGLSRAAIQFTKILGPAGSYRGIDVIRELIDWGATNITPRHPNFHFSHVDIQEPWFNPEGKERLGDYRIPMDDATVDLVILFSVFTHLLPPDLDFYLREFRRVLRPTGRVFATVFLVDDAILASRGDPGSFMSFRHYHGGCYIDTPEHPTRGVAYRFEALDRMTQDAGLEFTIPPIRGSWSGRAEFIPLGGQDNIILRRHQ